MVALNKWQRFRPRERRGTFDDITVFEKDTIYVRAREVITEAMHQARSAKPSRSLRRISRAAKIVKSRSEQNQLPEYFLASLILQTPNAVKAQREMDRRHGGYNNRQARLYELIDFNDTFVDTVLSLDESLLEDFTQRLWHEIDVFCRAQRVDNFSLRQFDAIVHGLSREIAVYRGAKKEGYLARMTSRSQDAMGIDVIITDPETKKSIAVDVKTKAAFRWRLVQLEKRRRIDEEKRLQCELAGFCTMRNGKGEESVDVVLLRIATDRLGKIDNYSFNDTAALGGLIADALENHGKYVV